jgi:hypothetical protein
MSDPVSEDQLVQRLRGGDPEALAALFELHRARLRRMAAWRIDPRLNGRLDPSDVLQRSISTRRGDCRRTARMPTCRSGCGCAC